MLPRLKEEFILLSADGPHRNVLKFKPPMIFSRENVDEVVSKIDEILSEMEDEEVDLTPKRLAELVHGNGDKATSIVQEKCEGHAAKKLKVF